MSFRLIKSIADTLGSGIALMLAISAIAHAEPVYVAQADEEGSGYTFRKGNECFLVTAEHVIPGNGSIKIVDARNSTATAEVMMRGSGKPLGLTPDELDAARKTASYSDVAVASIRNFEGLTCNTEWDTGEATADLVAQHVGETITAARALKNGGTQQKSLRVSRTTPRLLTLTAVAPDRFIPGDSGTFIFLGEGRSARPIGMIVNVEGSTVYALPLQWLDPMVRTYVGKASVVRDTRITMLPPSASVNLYGGDYRFAFPATVEECSTLCLEDARCRSYTYVNAGIQAATPICWMKSSVPVASRQPGTASGVKSGASAAPAKDDAVTLLGEWHDVQYAVNNWHFTRSGSGFQLTRTGQMATGESFDVTGTATQIGRAVNLSYTARSGSAQSRGACAGAIMEGPDREPRLKIRCNDSQIGVYDIDAVKSE